MATSHFQPADHLHSRTFIGLLIAQFLAAFNDQAIHASAMFFAINTATASDSTAITLMPILFYAPWAIFCTVAGWLADRFSKRFSLVLWKVVEVGITALALGGFWLGRHGEPQLGACLVLSTVFLMGMHSAFFVPAKYGAMPEILTPRMLSRGNGVLESLSFLAIILGTVAGGVLSTVFRGNEYLIGVILTGLALVGAVASFFIERIPAANPHRPFPPLVYQPLVENIRRLLTSRPLVFAIVGIAFFTFLVAYMRQVVYMHGQSQLPPWSEARTSIIVGMVALGIGLGSPLVGYLSGGKVEVGLVPIGALGMMVATGLAGVFLFDVPVLVVCIVLVGFFTGFYLVPLFSLLQHRAPKTSKGDAVATSNFINITGALAASLVFGAINWLAIRTEYTPPLPRVGAERGLLASEPHRGEDGHIERVEINGHVFHADYKGPRYTILRVNPGLGAGTKGDEGRNFFQRLLALFGVKGAVEDEARAVAWIYEERDVRYIVFEQDQGQEVPNAPLYNKEKLPRLLFYSVGIMTLLVLLALWRLLPDLPRRTWLWLRAQGRYQLELAGMLRLPASGPALVVTDARDSEGRDQVERAADRVVHFVPAGPGLDEKSEKVLARGGVVGLCLDCLSTGPGQEAPLLPSVPILPVHRADVSRNGRRFVYVVAGPLIAPGSPLSRACDELRRLAADTEHRVGSGEPLEKEAVEH